MKRNIFALLMLCVGALFLFCILYPFLSSSDYAVKINGECISKEEYRAYFYINEQRYKDSGISKGEIKQMAVKDCICVYAAVRFAGKNNIRLTADEKKAAEEAFERLKENKKDGISENVLKNACRNIIIYNKIYRYITDDYVVSEKDFEAAFNEYYESRKKELNNVYLSYIFINSREKGVSYAEEIYGKALNGYNFRNLAKEYSDEKEYGVIDVKKSGFDSTVTDAVFDMSEEEITLIETDKGFYIIKAERVETPDLDALKESILEEFAAERKEQIYEQQNDKWLENDTIERNEGFIESF